MLMDASLASPAAFSTAGKGYFRRLNRSIRCLARAISCTGRTAIRGIARRSEGFLHSAESGRQEFAGALLFLGIRKDLVETINRLDGPGRGIA